ncbi:hypothetical protein FisN_4Lh440 [Fistulifera solaris]|uniref:4Fe-4S ferredoxin-type domain-containing protein n=1 Tax=Fistulifera solaris TaxID=1519565 RepID=A0A1Z5KDW3_FISSO|nr:hypothetical protein FisN_4Lh440 [Fistulifera solaris]|eukprot:GAX24325.1 hypothetical protein FisN_4Lh440 [Fistulifera solaris]
MKSIELVVAGLMSNAAQEAVAFSIAPFARSSYDLRNVLQSSTSEWSVTDNWEDLSQENLRNSALTSNDIFHQDLAWKAAVQLEQQQSAKSISAEEDQALQTTISQIMSDHDELEAYESINHHVDYFEEELGREISLLVRCNESPEEMLTREGRLMPSALSLKEKNDPAQLVVWIENGDNHDSMANGTKGTTSTNWKMTSFFQKAVEDIFFQHATEQVMDCTAVASWMRKSLQDEQIGPHDGRVRSTISLHGTYGKGFLTLDNFCQLYLAAVVGTSPFLDKDNSHPYQTLERRQSSIQAVWRDIRKHGIMSPNEEEFQQKFMEFRNTLDLHVDSDSEMIMDECEITDEVIHVSQTTDKEGRSSYELVELAQDRQSPLWMNDGNFVFIDEESCIGCTQCVSAAPASFRMVENGRARTYSQKISPDISAAVATCPVDCMHFVSFDELKELETARDVGDGRDDHRHFGNSPTLGYIGRTPLHVSRRGTDANHRSSWYHYLKNKCQSK